jgi:hypothetical protein
MVVGAFGSGVGSIADLSWNVPLERQRPVRPAPPCRGRLLCRSRLAQEIADGGSLQEMERLAWAGIATHDPAAGQVPAYPAPILHTF